MKIKALLLALLSGLLLLTTACSTAGENSDSLPELKHGKYYLDGNTDSGVYVELTEDKICMGGEKLKDYWINYSKKLLPEDTDEESIIADSDEQMEIYSTPSDYNYTIGAKGTDSEFFAIFFWSDPITVEKEEMTSGLCYIYNEDQTISLGTEEKFILK